MADPVEETVIRPLTSLSQGDMPPDATVADQVDVSGKPATNYGVDPVLRKRELGLLTKLEQAAGEQAGLAEKRSAALKPEYDKMRGMLDQPRPQVQLQQPPDAPDTRAQDKKAMESYFFPMLAFAAILSKAAGADMTIGLNMLSQGVMGMKMGRDEVAKQSIEEWKNKMASVKEKNAALIEQYRAVMDDRSMSMQEQQMRIGLIAAQSGDAIMAAQIKEKGITGALKALDAMQKQSEKADTLNQKMDALTARLEANMAVQKARSDTSVQVAVIRGQTAENVAETGAVSREKVAAMRQQQIRDRRSQKEKDALRNIQLSVNDLDRMIDQVNQKPGVAGAYGYVNRFVEMVSGYTGKTVEGDNPATRFRSAMNLLQAHLTKAAYGGRISNYEIHKMEDTIGGIGITDSPGQVTSKLREVRDILHSHASQMEEESEPFFDTPEDVSAAVKRGEIKTGDTVQTPWGAYKAR